MKKLNILLMLILIICATTITSCNLTEAENNESIPDNQIDDSNSSPTTDTPSTPDTPSDSSDKNEFSIFNFSCLLDASHISMLHYENNLITNEEYFSFDGNAENYYSIISFSYEYGENKQLNKISGYISFDLGQSESYFSKEYFCLSINGDGTYETNSTAGTPIYFELSFNENSTFKEKSFSIYSYILSSEYDELGRLEKEHSENLSFCYYYENSTDYIAKKIVDSQNEEFIINSNEHELELTLDYTEYYVDYDSQNQVVQLYQKHYTNVSTDELPICILYSTSFDVYNGEWELRDFTKSRYINNELYKQTSVKISHESDADEKDCIIKSYVTYYPSHQYASNIEHSCYDVERHTYEYDGSEKWQKTTPREEVIKVTDEKGFKTYHYFNGVLSFVADITAKEYDEKGNPTKYSETGYNISMGCISTEPTTPTIDFIAKYDENSRVIELVFNDGLGRMVCSTFEYALNADGKVDTEKCYIYYDGILGIISETQYGTDEKIIKDCYYETSGAMIYYSVTVVKIGEMTGVAKFYAPDGTELSNSDLFPDTFQ